MSYYIEKIDAGVRKVERRDGQFRLPPYWVADVIRPSRAVRAWLHAHGFTYSRRTHEWRRACISHMQLADWIAAD